MNKYFLLCFFLVVSFYSYSEVLGNYELSIDAEVLSDGWEKNMCTLQHCREDADTTKEYLILGFSAIKKIENNKRDTVIEYDNDYKLIRLSTLIKERSMYLGHSGEEINYKYFVEGEGIHSKKALNKNKKLIKVKSYQKGIVRIQITSEYFEYLMSINDGSISYKEEEKNYLFKGIFN